MNVFDHSLFEITLMDLRSLLVEPKSKLTIFYILSGSVHFQKEQQHVTLVEKNSVVINGQEQVYLSSSNENRVIRIQISYMALNNLLSNQWRPHIVCNTAIQPLDNKVMKLETAIIDFITAYYQVLNPTSELVVYQHLFTILDILTSELQPKKQGNQIKSKIYNQHILNILEYIEENYQKKITLQSLAAREFLSEAHISRLFKQEVGQTLMQYIYDIRTQHAVYDIETTELPFIEIAMNNGFPSIKRFNEVFKSIYHMTPGNYRKKYQKNQTVGIISTTKDNLYTKITGQSASEELILILKKVQPTTLKEQPKVIKLSFQSKKYESLVLPKKILNVPNLEMLLFTQVQIQIDHLQSTCPFTYLRANLTNILMYNEVSNFYLQESYLTCFKLLENWRLKPIFTIDAVILYKTNVTTFSFADLLNLIAQLIKKIPQVKNWQEVRLKINFSHIEKSSDLLKLKSFIFQLKQCFPTVIFGIAINARQISWLPQIFQFSHPKFITLTKQFPVAIDNQQSKKSYHSLALMDQAVQDKTIDANKVNPLDDNDLLELKVENSKNNQQIAQEILKIPSISTDSNDLKINQHLTAKNEIVAEYSLQEGLMASSKQVIKDQQLSDIYCNKIRKIAQRQGLNPDIFISEWQNLWVNPVINRLKFQQENYFYPGDSLNQILNFSKKM